MSIPGVHHLLFFTEIFLRLFAGHASPGPRVELGGTSKTRGPSRIGLGSVGNVTGRVEWGRIRRFSNITHPDPIRLVWYGIPRTDQIRERPWIFGD